jgi:hypothetical protein
MSHWAEIDKNNKVLRVLVCSNDDPNGDEGYKWLIDNLGGQWVKTSYNNKIRGVFAAIDYTYDPEQDIFVTPKPYPSWLPNGSYWKAPINKPDNDNLYKWDESIGNWVAYKL